MPTNSKSEDTRNKNAEPTEVQLLISWRHLGVASALGLLSLIDQWQITPNLVISGGSTLIALAAVVLLWPVVRQIAVRGGEIDLTGLRLKVNQIEKTSQAGEIDNAMRIEDLESEIHDLRTQVPSPEIEKTRGAGFVSEVMEDDVSLLERAVTSYSKASALNQFRERVEIDKQIIRRCRNLSLNALKDFLESQSWKLEAQMAVAVTLGLSPRKDEELARAQLLAELMNSRYERVRARSGQAAKRWGERRTTRTECRSILLNAVEKRLLVESPTSGASAYLQKAQEVLSVSQDWNAT